MNDRKSVFNEPAIKNTKEDLANEFYCHKCNYRTRYKCNYQKHIVSKKHIRNTDKETKQYVEYVCEPCGFSTKNKTAFTRHKRTKRHLHNCSINNKNHNSNNTLDTNDEETQVVEGSIQKNDKFDQLVNLTMQVMSQMAERDAKLQAQLSEERMKTSKLIEQQNNTIMEVVKKVGNTTINQNNGTIINNKVSVELLNNNFPEVPSLSSYITQALSDKETISLIENGLRFHEIFEKKVVRPMHNLDCISRPLLIVKQRTKNQRKNLFVKTEDGWEDDTNENTILNNSIDNAAYNLHQLYRKEFYNGDIDSNLDEYMDKVFNVREPLLTDKRATSKKMIMDMVHNNLEVDKDDLKT